jgi:hypothetical protein
MSADFAAYLATGSTESALRADPKGRLTGASSEPALFKRPTGGAIAVP